MTYTADDIERAARAHYESRPVQNANGGAERLAWDALGPEWQADQCEAMRAALSALPVLAGAEGFVCVPKEPTQAMLNAADGALNKWRESLSGDEKLLRHVIKDGRPYTEATVAEKHALRWRSMLAAAPAPASGGGDGWRAIEEVIAEFADAPHDGWIPRGLFGKEGPHGWLAWVGQCDAGDIWLGVAEDGTCWSCEQPHFYHALPAPPIGHDMHKRLVGQEPRDER